MKWFISKILDMIVWLIDKWLKLKHWLKEQKLRSLIRKCERLKFETGKQQFIIALNTGKLVIVTRRYIEAYNKMYSGKGRKMTYVDLCKLSIYKTN